MNYQSSGRVVFSSLVFILLLSTLTFAQQGWSKIASLTKGNNPATVNAVAYDGDTLWIVGAQGLLTSSYNDGGNFEEKDLGLSVGLNDVFIRKDHIWIVGDGGTIVHSTDGGRSFMKRVYDASRSAYRQSNTPYVDFYSVEFENDKRGYIVGDEGMILATSDGGFSWEEQKSGVKEQLFHLSFRGKAGWIVGTGGLIIHTDDGGKNWYPQKSGVDTDLNRVYFITEKIGLITGDKGTLLRTDNAGATWQKVETGVSEPLFGMSFVDKKTGWIVGYEGRVIRTYDGGIHWVEQASFTSTDLFSVSFRDHIGYAIGRDGLLLRYFEKR
ncbi:MAG: hypothetical protein HY231_23285 [Acidobacteria bacterium]|nr:hypothetical protein [Acidobacteriota bacterium]